MTSDPTATDRRSPWVFVLYRAGNQETQVQAERGLRHLCRKYLGDRFRVEVVDVTDPGAKVPPDVMAVPLVVRTHPTPERRVVGDLSDAQKAADFLGLTTAAALRRED